MQKIWQQLKKFASSCHESLKMWDFIAAPRRNDGLSGSYLSQWDKINQKLEDNLSKLNCVSIEMINSSASFTQLIWVYLDTCMNN